MGKMTVCDRNIKNHLRDGKKVDDGGSLTKQQPTIKHKDICDSVLHILSEDRKRLEVNMDNFLFVYSFLLACGEPTADFCFLKYTQKLNPNLQ